MPEIKNSLVEILTGAVVASIGVLGVRIIGFGEKIIIARFLGPSSYGDIVLGLTLFSLGSTIGLMGLNHAITRYLPRFDTYREKRGIIIFSLQLTSIISVLISVLIFVFADQISNQVFNQPEMVLIIKIFALAIPLASIGKIATSAAQGNKDPKWQTFLGKLTYPSSRLIFILIFVYFGLNVVDVSIAYLIGWGVVAVLGIYYLKSRIGLIGDHTLNKYDILTFSLPLLISGSMSFISNSIDTIVLGYFLSSERIGIYNAAYPLANLVLIAPQLLSTLFIPIMSEYHSKENIIDMRLLYTIDVRWIAILTIPGFYLIIFTPETFLLFAFGSEYSEGSLSLVIVATGFLIFALLGPNGGTVNMIGDSHMMMITTTTNAIVNLSLNLLLIPRFDIVGAALSTAVSYIIANSIVSVYLYMQTGIHSYSNSTVMAIIFILIIESPIYFIISHFLTGISVVLLVYLFTLIIFLPVYFYSSLPDETEISLLKDYSPINQECQP